MPVLPHASLSQFRPSCGSGSGLRGVLPRAASWSRGSRRCGSGFGPIELMQAYYPVSYMESNNEMIFEKVGYTEAPTRTDRHISARTWASLGITADPAAALTDDIGDVPVLFVAIPPGQASGDMPMFEIATPSTPVIGKFSVDAAHSTHFGFNVYLFDEGAAEVETTLAATCVTQKVPLYLDCPGLGGYWEDGITTPIFMACFGGVASFTDGVNRFKALLPDNYHLDYRVCVRYFDATVFGLFAPGAVLANGTYTIGNASLNHNNPPIGSVAGLSDTPCT